MRMSRSNEVYRKWGAFLESQWIGHSRQVREDHYLAITDDDFHNAAEWSTTGQSSGKSRYTEKCTEIENTSHFPSGRGSNSAKKGQMLKQVK
jgi:hypothetical protein